MTTRFEISSGALPLAKIRLGAGASLEANGKTGDAVVFLSNDSKVGFKDEKDRKYTIRDRLRRNRAMVYEERGGDNLLFYVDTHSKDPTDDSQGRFIRSHSGKTLGRVIYMGAEELNR